MAAITSRVSDALTRKRRLADAYQRVFGSDDGRMVLTDLLRHGGLLETSHEPGDPCTTAFNEGRRSMACEILAQLRWSEADAQHIALEQEARRRADTGEAA